MDRNIDIELGPPVPNREMVLIFMQCWLILSEGRCSWEGIFRRFWTWSSFQTFHNFAFSCLLFAGTRKSLRDICCVKSRSVVHYSSRCRHILYRCCSLGVALGRNWFSLIWTWLAVLCKLILYGYMYNVHTTHFAIQQEIINRTINVHVWHIVAILWPRKNRHRHDMNELTLNWVSPLYTCTCIRVRALHNMHLLCSCMCLIQFMHGWANSEPSICK